MPGSELSISVLYAAAFAVLLVIMGADVALLRMRLRIALQGLGSDKRLNRAIRIHGNFAEYVPLSVVLLILMEIKGAGPAVLHGTGGILLVSRLAHWAGLKRSSGPTFARRSGIVVTFLVLLFQAAWLAVAVLGR